MERQQDLQTNLQTIFQNRLHDWRTIRDRKLSDLDLKFLIALEDYFMSLPDGITTSKIKDVISKKRELRDVTQWNDFSSISSESEMMDFLPDVLR